MQPALKLVCRKVKATREALAGCGRAGDYRSSLPVDDADAHKLDQCMLPRPAECMPEPLGIQRYKADPVHTAALAEAANRAKAGRSCHERHRQGVRQVGTHQLTRLPVSHAA